MKDIQYIKDKLHYYKHNSSTNKKQRFYGKMYDILLVKIYDYELNDDNEVPMDFYIDMFTTFVINYKVTHLLETDEEIKQDLEFFLDDFNNVFFTKRSKLKIKPDEVLILEVDNNDKLDYNKGEQFYRISQKQYMYSHSDINAYERERTRDLWIFLRKCLFRMIIDRELISSEKLQIALGLYIDESMPKKEYKHERISDLKLCVKTFNSAFGTNFKYSDFGLSYQELSERYDDKDKGVKSEEDEKALLKLRELTHYYFDKIWNDSEDYKIKMSKTEAYNWLAKSLGIDKNRAHIALFDEIQCAKTIEEVLFLQKSNN